MLKIIQFIFLVALLESCLGQPYQQNVPPVVPPQKYEPQQLKVPPGVPPQKYQTQHQQQQQQKIQQQQPRPQNLQQVPQVPQQQVPQQQIPLQQVPQQQVPQQQVPQQQVPQQQVPQQQVPQQQVPQQKVPQKTGQPNHVHQEPKLLSEDHMENEKKHMEMHMDVPVDTADLSKDEMHFRYFKMHDIDKNNKLDGCELIKSLYHWHDGMDQQPPIYTDEQLERVMEYALKNTDLNNDGYIDYTEYRISNYKGQKAMEAAVNPDARNK